MLISVIVVYIWLTIYSIMKKSIFKVLLFLGFVAFVSASCFLLPSAKNKNENISNKFISYSVPDSQFQIGAFHNGLKLQYNNLTDLNFNVWHHYTTLTYGWNYDPVDNANTPFSQYNSLVDSRLEINKSNNLRTYFDRPIVEYLIAGQRVDYECERVPDTSFYSFNRFDYVGTGNSNKISEITDNSPFGINDDKSISRVLYCQKGDKEVFIDSNLYANRNLSYNVAANPWCNADAYDWFIMPRIRIDESFAKQPANKNVVICRIMIYGWYGELVKEIPINVSNFFDATTNSYNGNYLENYSFSNTETNLSISKSDIKNHFLPNPIYSVNNWDLPCNMDIKILFTGKCDMWIDRIRLENEPAHKYITLKDNDLIEKVNQEADKSMLGYNPANPIPNYFYFEECTLNHFSAIKTLNKQILARTNNKNSLIIWLNNFQINAQIPFSWKNVMNASKIQRLVQQDCEIPAMVVGWYGLEGWSKEEQPQRFSLHPNTLSPAGFDPNKGRISYPESPANYDNWLQNRFENDYSAVFNLVYVYKIMDSLTRKGMRIVACPQAHSFFMTGGPLKEPSNEEIEVQTCLAITYNTKGIMFYAYNSFGEFSAKDDWARGIVDNAMTPRTSTPYGQNKYQKIKDLSVKLKKWGSYIMRFNPEETQNCIYRNSVERSSFLRDTYFADVVSYKQGSQTSCTSDNPGGSNPPGLVYECNNERYMQAATFKTSSSDEAKYFMILNRRCSPYINDANENNFGGKRYMKIKFHANSPNFANHDVWKIVDLETNNVVLTFDKTKSALIDLGWFMPGEGKLYKIIPN